VVDGGGSCGGVDGGVDGGGDGGVSSFFLVMLEGMRNCRCAHELGFRLLRVANDGSMTVV